MTMSSNGKTHYKLRHLPKVAQEIVELTSIADAGGRKVAFLAALQELFTRLQTEPSVCGDPEYNLHKPGACVYHAIVDPALVRYAVFEHEQTVLITQVSLLSPKSD